MRIALPIAWVALVSTSSGCIAQYEYEKSAPPVVRTVALVESSPDVARVLGEGVSVSLAIATEFERDYLQARLRGRDTVSLLTKAAGSRGEAWLDVDATNIEEQGWAGRFTLRKIGRQVLRDGHYVSEGSEMVLEGTYAPDGTPIVAPEGK